MSSSTETKPRPRAHLISSALIKAVRSRASARMCFCILALKIKNKAHSEQSMWIDRNVDTWGGQRWECRTTVGHRVSVLDCWKAAAFRKQWTRLDSVKSGGGGSHCLSTVLHKVDDKTFSSFISFYITFFSHRVIWWFIWFNNLEECLSLCGVWVKEHISNFIQGVSFIKKRW